MIPTSPVHPSRSVLSCRLWWRLSVLAAAGLLPTVARAAAADPAPAVANLTAATATPPPDESPQYFSRVRGLFDIDLPGTVKKYDVKLTIHPHFGDFTRKPFVRIPVGARFGINDRTEVNFEAEAYVSHGLKDHTEGNGFYALHLGAKYEWAHWLKEHVDISTGFTTNIPVGRPPLELTDGLNHIAPYVVFSKTFPAVPQLAPFISFGADLVSDSSVPGTVRANTPRSHAMGVSPGFIYDAGAFKYTLVLNYSTTEIIGNGSNHYYGVNPSVLWQLPKKLTFNSNGKWVVGLGYKWTHGPDGTDSGTSVKLRGEFKFTRLLDPLKRRVTEWVR